MVLAAAGAQCALGANYNEHFEDADYRDLEKADARWVRLFLPMLQVDRGAAEHGAVKTILDAGSRGYKTILTLKFPYNRMAFPKVDGPEFIKQVARLDAALPLVMGKVNILVIGNEPFIEPLAGLGRERGCERDCSRAKRPLGPHALVIVPSFSL